MLSKKRKWGHEGPLLLKKRKKKKLAMSQIK
jgi:hypothetical protein